MITAEVVRVVARHEEATHLFHRPGEDLGFAVLVLPDVGQFVDHGLEVRTRRNDRRFGKTDGVAVGPWPPVDDR